jgi:YVTN family beta-propeller protein
VLGSTATGAVSAPIPVGAHPVGVAITPDGKHVYVTNNNNGTVGSVSVIDTATGAVSYIHVTVGIPEMVAITPDGKYAYVNKGTAQVTVITTATGKKSRPIPLGTDPFETRNLIGGQARAVTPDGKHAYVAHFNNPINQLWGRVAMAGAGCR